MSKIIVTLDVNKLKGLAKDRTFNTRDGQPVTVKELKFELVEVKEPKITYSADKYDLVKTHFAAVPQTKEQRAANEPTVYIGEGITTVWKNDTPAVTEAKVIEEEDEYF